MNQHEKRINEAVKEVEKILKENCRCQGITITIDMQIEKATTINYEVKNRFPQISEV